MSMVFSSGIIHVRKGCALMYRQHHVLIQMGGKYHNQWVTHNEMVSIEHHSEMYGHEPRRPCMRPAPCSVQPGLGATAPAYQVSGHSYSANLPSPQTLSQMPEGFLNRHHHASQDLQKNPQSQGNSLESIQMKCSTASYLLELCLHHLTKWPIL